MEASVVECVITLVLLVIRSFSASSCFHHCQDQSLYGEIKLRV